MFTSKTLGFTNKTLFRALYFGHCSNYFKNFNFAQKISKSLPAMKTFAISSSSHHRNSSHYERKSNGLKGDIVESSQKCIIIKSPQSYRNYSTSSGNNSGNTGTENTNNNNNNNNKNNKLASQQQQQNSLIKQHWPASIPPSLNRKDRQILAHAGFNFSNYSRPKVLPQRNSNCNNNNTNSCVQKTVLIDYDSRYSRNAENSSKKHHHHQDTWKVNGYQIDKSNIFNVLRKQISCPFVEASPPIQLFKEEDRNRLNALYSCARGLSVISSPAPLQTRDDSAVNQGNQAIEGKGGVIVSSGGLCVSGGDNNGCVFNAQYNIDPRR